MAKDKGWLIAVLLLGVTMGYFLNLLSDSIPKAYPGNPNFVTVYIESPSITSDMSSGVSWVPDAKFTPWFWDKTGTKAIVILQKGFKYTIVPEVTSLDDAKVFSQPEQISLDLTHVQDGKVIVIRIEEDRTYKIINVN